ncbi:tripartite tricarboxylate transporter TctB family protein [Virgibacillus sp. JSM 102003]|uniref:tripartite tricarboxylate transporter TctB family protein n=1 Tax=Virgibacillus sp. JSM 102003 TaxID=1562108 RepID=UPI0035C088AB
MLMEKEKLRKADLVMSIFLMALSLFFLIISLNIDVPNATFYTSPGLLPAIICILTFCSSISLFISAWRQGSRITKLDIKAIRSFFKKEKTFRILTVVGIFTLYIFILMPIVSFTISTFIYLSLFMYVFKAGGILKILIISAVTTVLTSYIFGQLIGIPLP